MLPQDMNKVPESDPCSFIMFALGGNGEMLALKYDLLAKKAHKKVSISLSFPRLLPRHFVTDSQPLNKNNGQKEGASEKLHLIPIGVLPPCLETNPIRRGAKVSCWLPILV